MAPTSSLFNEAGSCVITSYGKTLILYDVSTGELNSVYEDMCSHDISATCLDGERGRKMYVGTSVGELLLVNTTTGMVLDAVHFHSKEITSLCEKNKGRSCVYSASMDGHLRLYEENNGKLHLHHSLENAFGLGVGITRIKNVPSLSLIVASGSGTQWGVFHDTSMKKLFVVHQEETVTAFEILGASRDKADEEHKAATKLSSAQLFALEKETLLTVALAMASGVVVYTMCTEDYRGVKTYELLHSHQVYFTDLTVLKAPDVHSVNYSSVRASSNESCGARGFNLIGVSDDGLLVVWDTANIRFLSEAKHRKHYEGVLRRSQQAAVVSIKPKPQQKKRSSADDHDNQSTVSGGSKQTIPQPRESSLSPTARERRRQNAGSPNRHFFLTEDESGHHPDRLNHCVESHNGHGHGHGGHHTNITNPVGIRHNYDDERTSHSRGHHGHGNHHNHNHNHHHGNRHDQQQHHHHGDHHDHHGHHSGHNDNHSAGHHGHSQDSLHSGESSGERGHHKSHQDKHTDHHHHHHIGSGDHHHHQTGKSQHADSHPHQESGHHGHGHSHGHGHHHHQGGQHGNYRGLTPGSSHSTHPAHPAALGGPKGQKSKSAGGANWVEMQFSTMFPLPKNQKFPGYIRASKSWTAHVDSIPCIVPMNAHGCILTVSLDGFHRVWNLDKQCLGELVLPNLTEQMKATSMCKDPGTSWRFILERIPVTKHHIDISQVLVKYLKQTRQVRAAVMLPFYIYKHSLFLSVNISLHDLLRKNWLRALRTVAGSSTCSQWVSKVSERPAWIQTPKPQPRRRCARVY